MCDITDCVCAGNRPSPAFRCRRCSRLCDRLLLRRQCCAAGAVKSGSFLFEQQRRGWDAVRRLADRAVRLVRLRFCVFAAVYVVSWFFADSGRFRDQRFFVRLYGGRLPEFRLRPCVLALLRRSRSARHFSCAGAVSARNALRADVCASARAAARPASPRIIGAIFPGAGACVLPAVGGCGRRVLCSTVFHTAYSVTCGHCG